MKNKRCRWCAELVSPLAKSIFSRGDPLTTPHQIALVSAQEQIRCLGDWFREINQTDPKFDFSGIFWKSIFAAQGWHFLSNVDHFLKVKLPNECDVVMANMVFHHSFCHSTHFQFRDNRKKFALVLQRCSSSNQEPSLFFQSRKILLMHTMSVMMLENREKNTRTQFFDLVLRRVHTKRSLQLSNGLGVRLLQRQEPEEPEDNS